jgi:hypothetical protein
MLNSKQVWSRVKKILYKGKMCVQSFTFQAQNTVERLKTAFDTVLALKNGLMELTTSALLEMTTLVDLAPLHMRTETCMRESGKTIWLTDRENITTTMALTILGIGKTTCNMERERKYSKMDLTTTENFNLVKNTDLDNTNGLINKGILATF